MFAVLPALGILAFTAVSEVRHEVRRALNDAHRLAKFSAEINNSAINGSKHLLLSLSQVPQIKNQNPTECEQILRDLINIYPSYENLLLFDRTGAIVCAGRPLNINRIPTNSEWFTKTLADGTFYFGTSRLGLVTGATEFSLSLPVETNSEITGVLAATYNLSWFRNIASSSQLPPNTTLTVLDKTGKIMAMYPEAGNWIGRNMGKSQALDMMRTSTDGTFRAVGLDGIKRLFGFTTIPGQDTNLRILVGLPEDAAYEYVKKVVFYISIWIIFSSVIFVSAWVAGSLFVLSRINKLSKATKKITAGDLSTRTGISHGIGEISQLAQALDQMAETLQKRDAELAKRTEELKRSNDELEQFAHIASHDLQEPLRIISKYTQLLAEGYKDKLDSEANKFINQAVDGTKRMQQLIDDILKYSLIEKCTERFSTVDLNIVMDTVKTNLRETITETQAVIKYTKLPTVLADAPQMIQLFQNLVSYALKFRKTDIAPEIEITSLKEGEHFKFTITDNGIGIDEKNLEKIFVIFHRLNTKEDQPGTGIGLAICKKIVERHGGKIHVRSTEGRGSEFTFTISGKA